MQVDDIQLTVIRLAYPSFTKIEISEWLGRERTVLRRIVNRHFPELKTRRKSVCLANDTYSVPSWYINRIKRRSKIKKIKYNVSMEYLQSIFTGCCAISGLPIKFNKQRRWKEVTASLDRIDSSKGYVEGNVQWLHKDINNMKCDFDQSYFLELCKKVVEHNGL